MKLKKALLLALIPAQLWGQDTLKMKNEIGLFVEGDDTQAQNVAAISTFGLSYKRIKNDFFSWNAAAGLSNCYGSTELGRTSYVNPDTTRWKKLNISAQMATLSGGVEVQRRFYKKVYLFAGGDLRISVGKGNYDTVTGTEFKRFVSGPVSGPSGYYWEQIQQTSQGQDVSIAQVAIVPFIGIKLALGRFNLGLRYGTFIKYHSERTKTNATGIVDFNSGIHYRRIYLTYRF